MQKVVLFDYLCKANIEKPPIRMRYNPILLIMAATLCLLSCKSNSVNTIYQFSALSNKGQEVNFADYKGKVLLIVNTASKSTQPRSVASPLNTMGWRTSIRSTRSAGWSSSASLVTSSGIRSQVLTSKSRSSAA